LRVWKPTIQQTWKSALRPVGSEYVTELMTQTTYGCREPTALERSDDFVDFLRADAGPVKRNA